MIEEEKTTLDHRKEIYDITYTIFTFKQKQDEFDDVERQNDENSKKLTKLYKLGVINEHGELIDKPISE